MKWEYKILERNNNTDVNHLKIILEDLGDDGWELVAVSKDPTSNDYQRYFFKRPRDGSGS